MKEKDTTKYVAGIDGGGTKTACMVADDHGKILSYVIMDGSNHQICGLSLAAKNVVKAVQLACSYAGISQNKLSYIFLGMAGADLPEDIKNLTAVFRKEFHEIPFTVVNDRWNVFACEANDWGAVSVCGTGSSMAVIDKKGKIYSTRALRYMLGNYGGGNHLTEMAMHHAFRCDEHTGPYTRLVEELPSYCNCSTMDELANRIYSSNYSYHLKYNIPKLIFHTAHEGDGVCIKAINDMGTELGTMIAGLIKKAGLESEAIPVVLSGSMYVMDEHQQLIKPLEVRLKSTVPYAELQIVKCPPVIGAVIMGLNQLSIRLSPEVKEKMKTYNRVDYRHNITISDATKEE